MPRSLRWLTAVSTAIVAFFVFSALTLGLAKAAGNDELTGGVALIVSLGGTVLPLLAALAVNDWLRERYGLPERGSAQASGGAASGGAASGGAASGGAASGGAASGGAASGGAASGGRAGR